METLSFSLLFHKKNTLDRLQITCNRPQQTMAVDGSSWATPYREDVSKQALDEKR